MNNNVIGGNIAPSLATIVNRLEKLSEDKKAIQADINEVFNEAREKGLDVKTVREVLKIRKQSEAERQEREHLRDVYLSALGLLDLGGE